MSSKVSYIERELVALFCGLARRVKRDKDYTGLKGKGGVRGLGGGGEKGTVKARGERIEEKD